MTEMIKGTITEVEGNKAKIIVNEQVEEHELEDHVIDFATLGACEFRKNPNNKKIDFISREYKPEKSEGKSNKKWEDDMVKFEDLLTEAHKKANDSGFALNILTEVVRDGEGKPMINLKEKFAVFKAVVNLGNDGKEINRFTGHGDSTSENVTGDFIKPHFIRMAETRAICRALRWYTNNACAEEEK